MAQTRTNGTDTMAASTSDASISRPPPAAGPSPWPAAPAGAAERTSASQRIVLAGLGVLILAGSWCQVGLGARYSESGEQLGLALPVATLVLGAAGLAILILTREWPVPVMSWPQAVFLALWSVGIMGLARGEMRGGLKEAVQVGEIVVLSPLVFWVLARHLGGACLDRAVAWLCAGVLVLGASRLHRLGWIWLSDAKLAVFVIIGWPFLVRAAEQLAPRRRVVVYLVGGLLVGVAFHHAGLLLCWLLVAGLSAARLARGTSPWPFVGCGLIGLVLSLVPALHPVNPWSCLYPRYDKEHLRRWYIEAGASLSAPLHYPLGGGVGQYKRTINQLKQFGTAVPHPRDEKVPRDSNSQYLLTLVESGTPAALALLVLLGWAARTCRRGTDDRDPGERARATCLALAGVGIVAAACFSVVLSRGVGIWVGAVLGLALALGPPPTLARRLGRTALPAVCVLLAAAVSWLANANSATPGAPSRANEIVAGLLIPRTVRTDTGLRVITLPDPLGAQADGAAGIRVEGEAFVTKSYPFTKIQANDASGNAALAIPNKVGKGMGQAEYAVEIPADGVYVLQARVYWEDGCSNSLQFETAGQSVVLTSDMYQFWHLLEAKRPLELRQGRQRFSVRNLEDGVRLDYWGLRRTDQAAKAATAGTP